MNAAPVLPFVGIALILQPPFDIAGKLIGICGNACCLADFRAGIETVSQFQFQHLNLSFRPRFHTGFDETISPRRFRTTVLTDLYDMTKDIKQAQAAAGHTTVAMTLKHYVKGRQEHTNTAVPIASAYGLYN